ncbi:MAG: hypothetical protein ACKVP0_05600 [Pirellulaceae bacterium]
MQLSEMTSAYWGDKSHKIHNRQPIVLMSAPKPPAVTSDDLIVRAAVDSAVAELLASKSGETDDSDKWVSPLNPIVPKSFDDERLFS